VKYWFARALFQSSDKAFQTTDYLLEVLITIERKTAVSREDSTAGCWCELTRHLQSSYGLGKLAGALSLLGDYAIGWNSAFKE
jgi:hypothetical protein